MGACSDSEDTAALCQDGIDNDSDGIVDCDEESCAEFDYCKSQSSEECGDGVVTAPELCDTAIAAGKAGACPTSCDDGDACTKDSLKNADSCAAACEALPITACDDDDGCCPTECNATNDNDCKPTCGNGVVEEGELCDTEIPEGKAGACPTACDDDDACTVDELLDGDSCSATCGHEPMTQCVADSVDGCCPAGCNAVTDADCSPTCGNGVLEPEEACDTAIPAGDEGACPASCDDGDACTTDELLLGGTCGANCTNSPITQCSATAADGCCPTACTAVDDSDCTPTCGNGLVELNETCDTTIAAGDVGACPTGCDDGKACTKDTLVDGGSCTASCTNVAITDCQGGDGCCAPGCDGASDSDCSPTCGNGLLETGETCDIAIPAGQPGACPANCPDQSGCVIGEVLQLGTCNQTCGLVSITQCSTTPDGCCPSVTQCCGPIGDPSSKERASFDFRPLGDPDCNCNID